MPVRSDLSTYAACADQNFLGSWVALIRHRPEPGELSVAADTTGHPLNDSLLASLETVPGATAARRELLARLGFHTVGDLLFHFPRSYEDLTDIRSINALTPGTVQTVRGEVVEVDTRALADGRFVVRVVLSDGSRTVLEGIWFNQSGAARRLRYGQRLSFSGKPKWYRDRWQISNPACKYSKVPEIGRSSPPPPSSPSTH